MGVYTYIQDWELPNYNKVSDEIIQNLINSVLESGIKILVIENEFVTKKFLRKEKTNKYYYIYFDTYKDNKRTSEVRCCWGVDQDKRGVINYLSGLIDGVDAQKLYKNDKTK